MLWFIVSLAIVPCSCTAPADHVTTSSSDASEPEDAYEPEEFMPPIPPPMTPPIPTTPILGPAPGTPDTPPLAHLMWLERKINAAPCGVVQRRPLPKQIPMTPLPKQIPMTPRGPLVMPSRAPQRSRSRSRAITPTRSPPRSPDHIASDDGIVIVWPRGRALATIGAPSTMGASSPTGALSSIDPWTPPPEPQPHTRMARAQSAPPRPISSDPSLHPYNYDYITNI